MALNRHRTYNGLTFDPVKPSPANEAAAAPNRLLRPTCDFRVDCRLIGEVFPACAERARTEITATPHLAEALNKLGLPAKEAVDMAIAMQEARHEPFQCTCVGEG